MQPFHSVHQVTTLTNAQIKALPTTPIEIVATPGAGKLLLPLSRTYKANFSAGAYTNVNEVATLQIVFHSDTAAQLAPATFFPQAGRWTNGSLGYVKRRDVVDQATAQLGFALLAFANTRLDVSMANASDGNLTGGHADNFLIVDTHYIEMDVPGVLRLDTGQWFVDDDPTGDPPDGYLTTTDAGATLLIDTTLERGLALAITDGSPETFYP